MNPMEGDVVIAEDDIVGSTLDAHRREREAGRARLLDSIRDAADVTFIRIHGNIGDELIYAGARQLLSVVDYREISMLHVQGASGDVAIISGGGGWCATYHDLPRYLPLIEKRFHRVVIFPSTFDCSIASVREALATTKATVFARERVSLSQIESLCDASIAFDTAFYFDYRPYLRSGRGTLLAYRQDREASGHAVPRGNNDISDTCESLDEWLWTIARHEAVHTDRAHVMIAAAMLGKSVEYRSSNYHKVPAIANYSLTGFPIVRREIEGAAPNREILRTDPDATFDELTWTRRSIVDIAKLAGPNEQFILVDNEQLRYALGPSTTAHYFIERDGRSHGAPRDSDEAIRELETMRANGARMIVFAWPAFWWLDHYDAFTRYLRESYEEVVSNPRIIAFDLAESKGITR